MKLIGMLDSPYVRRVAISLQLLEVPFEHQSLSVFSTFEQFRAINPVVKAPTLVCDDGTLLMDSTLIIDYAESIATKSKSLMPADTAERRQVLHILGLALAACEKSVQLIYERNLRPPEKQHEPWATRVIGQMLAAYGELEAQLGRRPLAVQGMNQAGLTTAVVWHFLQAMLPEVIPAQNYPRLQAFSTAAEQLPVFRAAPHGGKTVAFGT
jgi:glutathione S-transferase